MINRNGSDLPGNLEFKMKDDSNKLGQVVFWIACAVAGFALPTAFAGWMGWLDPILK